MNSRLVIFSKTKELINNSFKFTVIDDNSQVLFTDLKAGTWIVHNNSKDIMEFNVQEESGTLFCILNSGDYELTREK